MFQMQNSTLGRVFIFFYCPYAPRLGTITAENRQKYSAILCLVSCSLTPKFSNPVFDLVEDRLLHTKYRYTGQFQVFVCLHFSFAAPFCAPLVQFCRSLLNFYGYKIVRYVLKVKYPGTIGIFYWPQSHCLQILPLAKLQLLRISCLFTSIRTILIRKGAWHIKTFEKCSVLRFQRSQHCRGTFLIGDTQGGKVPMLAG